MSPERLRIPSEPAAARVADGDLNGALERLVARERRDAFERGVVEGERRASVRAAGALDRAAELLDTERSHAAHLAVAIALEIARVLLRREAQTGNYELEKIVREALSFSGVGRGRCVVHVNPEDAQSLSAVSFRTGTVIEADATIARGNVQVSTPQGLLVREFEQALTSIGERLREELG